MRMFCLTRVLLHSQDAINSASTITRTLSGELADGQRKLLAFAAAGANSNAGSPLATQLSNGPLAGLHEMVSLSLSLSTYTHVNMFAISQGEFMSDILA